MQVDGGVYLWLIIVSEEIVKVYCPGSGYEAMVPPGKPQVYLALTIYLQSSVSSRSNNVGNRECPWAG